MSVEFWLAAAVLIAGGVALLIWPLVRAGQRLTATVVAATIAIGTVVFYPVVSNYQPRTAAFVALSQANTESAVRAAADTLLDELMAQPANIAGWRLLGKRRLELAQYDAAEFALRQALNQTRVADPELMVMLGESLSYGDVNRLTNEAITLFVNAYEMAPDIPKAMWYGGLAFAARGEHAKAADAWERLLAQGAPPNIAAILRERIFALRAMANPAVEDADSARLVVQVSLDETLPREWPASAKVFVSVRDPDRPGPPLAAVQRAPETLPFSVELTDADAMIPGRTLSSASTWRVTARLSMNGVATGGEGDYLGSVELSTLPESAVNVVLSGASQRK
ncbi:MAG: hypothetical protein AAGA84_04860 [Pseudomonadota bacterium]